jgi:hypothetical protein
VAITGTQEYITKALMMRPMAVKFDALKPLMPVPEKKKTPVPPTTSKTIARVNGRARKVKCLNKGHLTSKGGFVQNQLFWSRAIIL